LYGDTSTDPDNDTLSYTWSVTSGPIEVTDACFSATNAANPTFEIPASVTADPGPVLVTIELTVADEGTPALQDTIDPLLEITINRPPQAEAIPEDTIVDVDDSIRLYGNTSTDPDNDTLFYTWSVESGPPEITDACLKPSPNVENPDFEVPSNVSGTAPVTVTIELTVADEGTPALQDTIDSLLEITINRRPVADAGPDQTKNVGELVTLDSSGSTDPDGDPITRFWAQTAGQHVDLSDVSAINPTFTVTEITGNPILVFEVTVSDGRIDDTDPVTITINERPISDAGTPQTVNEGSSIQLVGTGSYDPDGTIDTYAWSIEPGGPPEVTDACLKPSPDVANPTFEVPDISTPGEVTFKLTVTDNRSFENINTDTNKVTITINRKPLANAGSPQTVTTGVLVTLDGTGSSDPDVDPMTYSWVQLMIGSEPSVELENDDTATPSFIAPYVAATTELTFELTIRDNGTPRLQDTDTVIIEVGISQNIIYVPTDYSTIGLAMANAVSAVDTIVVLGGATYEEDVILIDGITLKADQRRAPLIIGTVTMANNSTLEGFMIENTVGLTPVTIDSKSNVRIRHNTIKAEADVPQGTLYALRVIEPVFTNSPDPFDEDDRINIRNNVIITRATGANCMGRGLGITSTNLIPKEKVHIINNTIDIISESRAQGLYDDANNYYVRSSGETGIVVRNNIISIEAGSFASHCIYKGSTSMTYLPVRYNYLYVRPNDQGSALGVTRNRVYVYVYDLPGAEGNILREGGEVWLYVDLASLDFHIHENSVDLPISPELEGCIDTGDPTDEYYNEPEPPYGFVNTAINRGAYGNTSEATIGTDNPPPVAVIQSITGNPAEGESITFVGSGYDCDGTIQAYEWRSDNSTIIGDAPTMTYDDLEMGPHYITLSVQDDLGKWSVPSAPIKLEVGYPSDLAVSSVTTSSISLTWQDNSISEEGFMIKSIKLVAGRRCHCG
jgi:hypothetical protein